MVNMHRPGPESVWFSSEHLDIRSQSDHNNTGRVASAEGAVLMKNKGFTLIELLVVVAIIAILAAILFPVFRSAMNTSKASSCSSNLRQLGAAFRMYLDDWNRRAPADLSFPAVWGKPAKSGLRGWTELVYRYHRKIQLYKCPSRKVNIAYSINGTLETGTDPMLPSKCITLFECPGSGNPKYPIVPGTQNDALSGNSNQSNGDSDGSEGGQMDRQVAPKNPKDDYSSMADTDGKGGKSQAGWLILPGPHNGGCNVVFWDGHAQMITTWGPWTYTFHVGYYTPSEQQ